MKKLSEILSGIRPECTFENSTDFLADGLLDSFDVITLVSEIEESYCISIIGTDILPENFTNFASIHTLLERYGVHQ